MCEMEYFSSLNAIGQQRYMDKLRLLDLSLADSPYQGRTEEFGEGDVQYEFDEGAGQEVTDLWPEIIYRGIGNESRELYISTRASAGDAIWR